MLQMSTECIFADSYGMSIVGISRRFVAYIQFSLFRHCTKYIESRKSNTTTNQKKCLSIRNHIFLVLIAWAVAPHRRTGSITRQLWGSRRARGSNHSPCHGLFAPAGPDRAQYPRVCFWVASGIVLSSKPYDSFQPTSGHSPIVNFRSIF
jgi:hypothetical protein